MIEENIRIAPSAQPSGIGGWMILPLFGLVGIIFLTAKNLFAGAAEWEGLKLIFTSADSSINSLALPITLSFLAGLAIIFTASNSLYHVYRHSKKVPRLMTIHYIILIIAMIIEFWGDRYLSKVVPSTPTDPKAIKSIFQAIFAAAIWIPYFHRSKRVANTFTR